MCGMRQLGMIGDTDQAILDDMTEVMDCNRQQCPDEADGWHPSKDVDQCCWAGRYATCEASSSSVKRICCCGGMCPLKQESEEESCVAPCTFSGGKCDCGEFHYDETQTSGVVRRSATMALVGAASAGACLSM